MSSKPTKKKKVIYMDEELPFGKYKGRILSEVWHEDPSYITWLTENIDYYQFAYDVNTKWCGILDKDDIVPADGLYVIACMGDMHIIYEMYNLKKGERFWNYYEGDNTLYDGGVIVHCLAYCHVEQFSELIPKDGNVFDVIKWKAGFIVVVDYVDETGELTHAMLHDSLLGPVLDPYYVDRWCNVNIKSSRYVPCYTMTMLSNQNNIRKSKHLNQTNE